jgi:hypothetical protein
MIAGDTGCYPAGIRVLTIRHGLSAPILPVLRRARLVRFNSQVFGLFYP